MQAQAESREPRLYALVPCAGVGARAGTTVPKQYAAIAGRPMVAHTLRALGAVSRLRGVLLVISPQDEWFDEALRAERVDSRWVARCGGATRAASVAAGLRALRERGATDDDWVLVHDAARCLLQPQWVERLIDACLGDEVGGLLALPLADTLKEERGGGGDARVARTEPRSGKWLAQTPQMFRIGLLREALARAGGAVTDESSAVEALGLAPLLVPGDAENFKLTWPADFELARRLLQTR